MDKWQHIKAFISLPLMGFLGVPVFILLFISEPHIGWSLTYPFKMIPTVVGGILIGLGLFFIVTTTLLFYSVGKGTLAHWNPPPNLVVCGAYRYVRNPMIIGLVLTIFGEAILFGSVALFIWFFLVLTGNHLLFIKWEEPDLAHRFGDEYHRYMQHVRRWIPRPRPWIDVSGQTSTRKKKHVEINNPPIMEQQFSHTRMKSALAELEQAVHTALETYSNVHRGTGHNSMVTTALYERAREIVLEHLKLDKDRFIVIFCSPLNSEIIKVQLEPAKMHMVSSHDIGLPLGIRALAVERKGFLKGVPFYSGGGTIRMVYSNSVIWANPPEKFEAGTPNIINAIAFAKALQLIQHFGHDVFKGSIDGESTITKILEQDEFLSYSGKKLLLELRKTLVGREVRVPTAEGDMPYSNLDNAASTPTFSSIWNVVCQTWRQPERIRQEIVHAVKKICAGFLGAPLEEYDVLFTSNTTEAINIAVHSLGTDSGEATKPVVITTLLEHHSNELPWRYISRASIIRLSIDDEGFIDLNELERLLHDYNHKKKHGNKRIRIVAVSGASNVIGTFNDILQISQITHKYGAHLLVDAAQLVAHRNVKMAEHGIDYLAFSGHKAYAPFGSGGLVVRKGLLNFKPAELTKIKLSGEENVVGIAAMGKALTLLQRVGMEVIEEQEKVLTQRALSGLSRIPDVEIFGIKGLNSPQFNRRGGTIAFNLTYVPHNLVAKELAEYGGIGVRTGCFCAHILVRHVLRIHPLRSLVARIFVWLIPGLAIILLPGLIRVSFGIENDENDVDKLIQILKRIAHTPRSLGTRLVASKYNGTSALPHTEIQEQMIEFTKVSIQRVFSVSEEFVSETH